MTKLLLNYILIYAIIMVITTILILWRGKRDKNVILIIAGSSAIAILLFYLFYIPALDRANNQSTTQPAKSQPRRSGINSVPPEPSQLTQQTKPEVPEEIKGPFPVDETVPAKERQIGRLFNIWRKAVLTRNIAQINQLDSQIKGCGDEAIPFLTKLAKEDGNERVRAFATRVLGRMNLSDLSSLFMELLRNDTSAFVRENSCWALGRLGNTESLETLQKVADSDASEPVRQVAAEAIENIKSSAK